MKKHGDTIDALVDDLTPASATPRPSRLAALWLFGSLVWIVAVAFVVGPLRAGALEQIASHPRFFAELLIGMVGIVAVIFAVLRSGIPGLSVRHLLWVATGALTLWLSNFALGLEVPSLESGMLGKRPHCFLETLLYALPPLIAGALMLRRLYPLRPVFSLMGVGLASGLLPAWFMQLACMYDSTHILMNHVLPGLLVVPLAAVLALLISKQLGGD